jgi:hypothetical protein
VNEDNLSNVRWEASRHFRKKKREYLRDKIDELESNSKNKNIRDLYRGITDFKKGYQPRTKLVKDERGNLLVDPHRTINRWMNYFCQLLQNKHCHPVCTDYPSSIYLFIVYLMMLFSNLDFIASIEGMISE